MNEILAIFSKNKNLDISEFSENAFRKFREKFTGVTDEIYDTFYQVIVAPKTHRPSRISKFNDHITCLGGYLLNEPTDDELNNYKPESFHGKFVFVHINTNSKKAVIYNDALGHFPVFYTETEACFCFSSDLTFLLHLQGIDKSLEPQHIADYFFWGSTLPGTTFLKNVNLLAPASKLVFENGQLISLNNYKPETVSYNFKNIDESIEALNHTFGEVIDAYYKYYGKLQLTLTGGLDTRYIASFIKDGWDAEFVTLANKLVEYSDNSEIQTAKEVARFLGIPHKILDSNAFPTPIIFDKDYFLQNNSFDDKTPVVTGIFGSEILKFQAIDIIHHKLTEDFLKNKKINYQQSLYYKPCPILSNKLLRHKKDDLIFSSLFTKSSELKRVRDSINNYRRNTKSNLNRNPVLTIADKLTRAFFSNYYGGSRGGWVCPNQFFANFLLPYADQKVLNVVSSFDLSHFGMHSKSIYSVIFGKYKKALGLIPTNSILAEFNEDIFTLSKSGLNPINYRKNNDDILLKQYIENSKIFELNIFDKGKMKNAVHEFDWIKDCFIDFSVWLDYIENCKIN